jgi:hypothetical protein
MSITCCSTFADETKVIYCSRDRFTTVHFLYSTHSANGSRHRLHMRRYVWRIPQPPIFHPAECEHVDEGLLRRRQLFNVQSLDGQANLGSAKPFAGAAFGGRQLGELAHFSRGAVKTQFV